MTNEYNQFLKKRASVKAPQASSGHANPASRKSLLPAKKKPLGSGIKVRRKKEFPVFAALLAFVGLGAGLWVVYDLEGVENFIESVEVGVYPKSHAQTSSSGNNTPAAKAPSANSADAQAKPTTSSASEKSSWTPEEVALFKRLDERKKQLDLREAELSKLEEELQRQKSMLDQRLRELEGIRSEVATQLEQRVEVDQTRVATLVDVYSNMKPANAAKVFETLDEDLAVEVLGSMKKKNAADILNVLPAEKAQRLSEKYAGYKRR
jgi:flagellar motility protein MotE (MotC chaperone)